MTEEHTPIGSDLKTAGSTSPRKRLARIYVGTITLVAIFVVIDGDSAPPVGRLLIGFAVFSTLWLVLFLRADRV